MSRRDRIRRRLERDLYDHGLIDGHRDGTVVTIAAAQVEQAARHQRGASVRSDVTDAYRDEGPGSIDAQLERGLSLAQQLDTLGQRGTVPAERGAVIGTL